MPEQIISDIYNACAKVLEPMVIKSGRDSVSLLFNTLEKSDDWTANDISSAINLLEANYKWLASKVANHVLKTLNTHHHAIKQRNPVKSPLGQSLDQLSIVSKDVFEDWLMVNAAIKKVEVYTEKDLLDCSQIIAKLSGKPVDQKENPIGPNMVLRAIKKGIDELEIPGVAQALIYKSFTGVLSKELKGLYEEIQSIAARHNLDYKPAEVKKIRPVQRPAQRPVSRTTNDIPHIRTPERQRVHQRIGHLQTLNTLSRLNTSLESGQQVGRPVPVSEHDSVLHPAARMSERHANMGPSNSNMAPLLDAISEMQHSSAFNASQSSLRQWVDDGLARGEIPSGSIGEHESELIDVTDRFFDVIDEKVGVGSLLKSWLEKLKTTILRIVLEDEDFFSDGAHPARQLLNKLAKLSANDLTGNKRLETLLDKHIDRVIAEYDGSHNTIEEVVEQLNLLLERQEKAFRRNSERIAKTYEGKQKVAYSRSLVVNDLNAMLAGQSVPAIVVELLNKAGWREYMALTIVREGHKSAAYQDALGVISLLLLWLAEDSEDEDQWALRLEMELEASSLYDMVEKELSSSGFAGSEKVLMGLKDCLFNEVSPERITVEHYEWPFLNTETDLETLKPVRHDHRSMSHWHKSILAMTIGDWIEIKDENGKARSLRLAWAGSESFRFVFVDNQGMKDIDISLSDLVEKFKNDQASFVQISEVPLVDQGLHHMVQSVYEDLSNQSSCDVVTGLLNRQAFERAIDQSIAACISRQTKAVVLYIDIDKFSLANQNYGHQAGDAVLKYTAQTIRELVMEEAFCGRIGGNEFGVILSGIDSDEALVIAENIRKKIADNPFEWESFSIHNTLSIGLVSLDIEMDSYDAVMRKASLACESAKSNGQNRCVLYTTQDQDQKKRNEMFQWVQKLDGSLDDLLILRCQEIRPVDTSGDKFSHWEILLGVQHDGQVLPPSMIIEAAEHFDRMATIDKWVLHNVLLWMEQNPKAVAKTSGFSINLSGNSLSDENFLEFVLGELAASDVDPRMICFEITETAAINNIAGVVEFIRILKQQGCKFSLDDFGSGLSSYGYIQKLPVDFIKIDGIFIRNIVNNEQDQALVRSINDLAHFMGIETVAEFVENHEILQVLKEIGVDNSQGYGIKKPGLLKDLA